ncbi:MAG: glycosyl hydrolase family protein [Lachnospiraceae bacterium]|nr:glycosyl hydrolase family protein [Lachnospiraceae bacterium]
MILGLVLGTIGCTPASSNSEPLDNIPDRWTTEEEKIAVFEEGHPEGFWARNDRGNGGMFNCSFSKLNAIVADGHLTLKLDQRNNNYVGAEYRTHQQYSYGFYSVSMKPAKCSGVITSFFTYTGRPWDEIDIEFLGNDTTKVQFNYFVSGEGGHEYVYDLGFDASEEFHEYAFDWQPDSITWYVDGKAVYKVTGEMPQTAGHIMMNFWNVADYKSNWAGKFEGKNLPITAQYEWIGFSSE